MRQFTKDQLKTARKTDLYSFLLRMHPDSFSREGNSLRLKSNHSISIKTGYSGYHDFASDESGNSVDFLVRHMGYDIDDAVFALCGVSEITPQPKVTHITNAPLTLPSPVIGPYKNLFAYLMKRKISQEIIKALIDQGVLYQEKEHNNIVFVNKERDFIEIHGTLSYGDAFHGCRRTSPDRFWWFNKGNRPTTAYICEAAIDAISLYQLIKEDGYYISIAGVANQAAIDRIKNQIWLENIILAVDNDTAGQACREKNTDLTYMIPTKKDWNEDLQLQ